MIRNLTLEPGEADSVVFLPFAEPAGRGAPSAAISLRKAGDLSLAAADGGSARRRLLESLRILPERIVALRQVHSRLVHVVPFQPLESAPDGGPRDETAPGTGRRAEGDGMVTRDRELVLSVTVADCLPIFIYDSRNGALGLVHSGWRGTGIALEAMAVMGRQFGTEAGDVDVIIGPGIGACCYNVDTERAAFFRRSYGDHSVVSKDGQSYLDLGLTNERLLAEAGVRSLLRVTTCTSCSSFLGSFRRQGPEDYTHMLALFGSFG